MLDAAKVIIIDEISMCRIDLFDHVMGMISQSMTRNGAKQVVLVGDFFQLPPVVTDRDSALLMKFYPETSRAGASSRGTGPASISNRTSSRRSCANPTPISSTT